MDNFTRFIETMALVDVDQITSDIYGTPRIIRSAGDTVMMSIPVWFHHDNKGNKIWKVLRSIDSLTVAIAVRIGADKVATFDEGFNGLRNPQITSLMLSDAYSSSS